MHSPRTSGLTFGHIPFGGHRVAIVFASIVAVAALGALAATASTRGFFGGGDEGARQAPSSNPAAADTQAGITISLTGVTADETRTVVGLEIAGHPEYGEGAMPMGMAQLVDENGRIYRETSGSADQSNPRLVTRAFPALDPAARTLTLQVNGLQFVDRLASGESPSFHPVDAQWNLTFPVPARTAGVAVDVSHEPKALGPGTMVIDSVTVAASQVVINGHISGYSSEELAALTARPSLTVDGKPVPFVGMRAGFGPGRESVEIRYAPVSGPANLQVMPIVEGSGGDAAVSQALASRLEGAAPAEWDFTLP